MTEVDKLNLINRNNKIIEIIMKKINEENPVAVDMIAIGGSFCNGDIYEKSDLDLVIISKDDKAGFLDKCFILNDVAMDVYTHDWSSFEHMTDYTHPYVTKLIDLDIIYVHDDKVMNYYKSLQKKLINNMSNEVLVKENIQNLFSELLLEDFKLKNSNELGNAYRCLGNILKKVEFIIYMVNKSYVKRGTKRIPEEISNMDILPNNFIDIYQDIVNCKTIEEIKDKSSRLVICVTEFLVEKGYKSITKEEELELIEKSDIKPNNLYGTYEEIYSNWKNKMIHAVSIDSKYLSFVTMISCQEFYDEMYSMFNIPKIELIKYYNPNDLEANVNVFNDCMEKWLNLYKEFGININYYADLNELENLYNDKKIVKK